MSSIASQSNENHTNVAQFKFNLLSTEQYYLLYSLQRKK